MGGILALIIRALAWTGAGYIANDIIEYQQLKARPGVEPATPAEIAKEYTQKPVLIRIGLVALVIFIGFILFFLTAAQRKKLI